MSSLKDLALPNDFPVASRSPDGIRLLFLIGEYCLEKFALKSSFFENCFLVSKEEFKESVLPFKHFLRIFE